MIVTITSHGRKASDVDRLAAHLAKSVGQSVSIVASAGVVPGLSIAQTLKDLQANLSLSKKAQIGFHHVTLNPALHWTPLQRDEAVRRIIAEFKAQSHSWALVEHSEKRRASPGGASRHWHLILAHIGPTGRALDTRSSYARLEAVARACEIDFGEPITHSRRTEAVATHLARTGRADVAAAVWNSRPVVRPLSGMSQAGRQRAGRLGIPLSRIRADIKSVWSRPNLLDALKTLKLCVVAGEKPGVPVLVDAQGVVVGALHRLAGVPLSSAISRLEAEMKSIEPQKENSNGGRSKRQRQKSTPDHSWQGDAVRYPRNKKDSSGDPRIARLFRGISDPRQLDQDRGKSRYIDRSLDASQSQRRSALIEIKRAEQAARIRRRAGRLTADELRRVKLRLWEAVVGAEMSPEVAAVLYYVDSLKRVATLVGGGWVRDEGSVLYASGADPHVIALMVATAKAKEWSGVRLRGDQAFLAEARAQFEAAGIPVTIDGEPARAPLPDFNRPLREEVVDYFRNLKKETEKQISQLNSSMSPSAMLIGSRKRRDHAKTSWSEVYSQKFQAKKELELAQYNYDKASIFQKRKAAAVRDAAQKVHEEFEQQAAFLRGELEAAEKFLATVRSVHDHKCRLQAKENRDKLHRLARDRDIANICLDLISADPSAALVGTAELLHIASSQLDKKPSAESELEITIPSSGLRM